MTYKITFFAVAAMLAFMTGVVQYANAQVFDRTYAKSLILGGGPSGIDLTHTLTMSVTSLTSNEPLTLPANNAMGVLTNNPVGTLAWIPISIASFTASGIANQFLTTNGSGVVGWTTLNVDGTTLTGNGLATPLGINLANANTWTAVETMQNSSSTDALILTNSTAAVNNTQEYSPRLHLEGMGWKTNTTAGSQEVDWIAQVVPVQGSSNPTSYLDFEDGIANAGYVSDFDIFSSGGATIGSSTPVDPGLGVLNFGTGVQIAGTAASGTILEGNGTVFTASSALFPSAGSSQNILRSNGTSFVSTAVNTGQFTPANPTGTQDSVTARMMGLGTTATITPNGSGRLLIIVSGDVLNASGDNSHLNSATLQLRYGTGTAPANGDAATGTTLGASVGQQSNNDINQVAFSITGITPAQTVSPATPVWVDVSILDTKDSTPTKAPVSISNISISIVEL
jgi:hypothetical protein